MWSRGQLSIYVIGFGWRTSGRSGQSSRDGLTDQTPAFLVGVKRRRPEPLETNVRHNGLGDAKPLDAFHVVALGTLDEVRRWAQERTLHCR